MDHFSARVFVRFVLEIVIMVRKLNGITYLNNKSYSNRVAYIFLLLQMMNVKVTYAVPREQDPQMYPDVFLRILLCSPVELTFVSSLRS